MQTGLSMGRARARRHAPKWCHESDKSPAQTFMKSEMYSSNFYWKSSRDLPQVQPKKDSFKPNKTVQQSDVRVNDLAQNRTAQNEDDSDNDDDDSKF